MSVWVQERKIVSASRTDLIRLIHCHEPIYLSSGGTAKNQCGLWRLWRAVTLCVRVCECVSVCGEGLSLRTLRGAPFRAAFSRDVQRGAVSVNLDI